MVEGGLLVHTFLLCCLISPAALIRLKHEISWELQVRPFMLMVSLL